MNREQVWQEVEHERLIFADLLETLSPQEWEHPTMCDGWRVREVAAHVAMAPIIGPLSPWRDVIRAGGNFNRMAYQTARRGSAASPQQLVERVREMAGSRRMAIAMKPLDALLDVITHGQDVARPLGRRHPMSIDATRVAAERVWAMGFPFRARSRFRGFKLTATDTDFSRGEGLDVQASIGNLLLVLTGRKQVLDQMAGTGAGALARRFGQG